MCRNVDADAQWVVCSYCEQGKKLGIVLAAFDCRKTSLAVGLHLLWHAGLLLMGVVVSRRVWLYTLHGHLARRIRHLRLTH